MNQVCGSATSNKTTAQYFSISSHRSLENMKEITGGKNILLPQHLNHFNRTSLIYQKVIRSYKLKKVKCQIRSLAFINQAERCLTHLIAEGLLQGIFAYKTTIACLCSAKLFCQTLQQSFFFFFLEKSFLYHT